MNETLRQSDPWATPNPAPSAREHDAIVRAAVFLDRDDTLIANRAVTEHGDLGDAALVQLLPGVPEGLRRLREAGFRLIVVTNQGGVARGRYGAREVEAVHERIESLLRESTGLPRVIDRFYYCPFHPRGTVVELAREHPWRKPAPGMLLAAADELDLALERSWMVGDGARDVMAGRSAGCRTVLVNHPDGDDHGADVVASDFTQAVDTLLKRSEEDGLVEGNERRSSEATSEPAAALSAPLTAAPRPEHAEPRPLEIDVHAKDADDLGTSERSSGTTDAAWPGAALIEATEALHGAREGLERGARAMRDAGTAVTQGGRVLRATSRELAAGVSALEASSNALGSLVEPMRESATALRDQARRAEVPSRERGPAGVLAIVMQMLTIAVAVMAFLQWTDDAAFTKTMIAATFAQLFTIAMAVFDR